MGMFNDNVSASRLHWKFKYKGSELVAAAQKLLTQFTEREQTARVTMSG